MKMPDIRQGLCNARHLCKGCKGGRDFICHPSFMRARRVCDIYGHYELHPHLSSGCKKNLTGWGGKHYLSEFKDQQNTLFLSSAENVVLINNVNPAFHYFSASNLRIRCTDVIRV